MSNLEAQYHAPLLEKIHAPRLLPSTFSRTWITIVAMFMQAVLFSLMWTFSGVMIVKKTIRLPDNVASWTLKNPSDTNILVTVTSTVLGLIGSCLLGITVQHALTFRLSRGIRLSIATAWVQLARNSIFPHPRRHIWWTLLSVLWVAVIHFLTTAWSSLLTPVPVVQNFTSTGWELDLLKPAVSDLLLTHALLPSVAPTSRNFSLTPESFGFLANITGYLSQAGRSAVSVSINNGYPAFIGPFNSSTGGANPIPAQYQLADFPTLPADYRGLSTSYTLRQQGYTANISCRSSSSPTITLKNTASTDRTFESSPSPFDYNLNTWSWSTNCSGNGDYSTGEVDVLTSKNGRIGNGLFATSVCFYQDFSGPSNKSFLVLMQSPNNTGYSKSYLGANPSMPIVCQFTPMVTTLEIQYNQSGLVNIKKVLERASLPDDSWPLASLQGFAIWAAYFLAQGRYSNSFADDPLEVVQLQGFQLPNNDITPLLEQYLRGIFEYMGSVIRGTIESHLSPNGQPLPENMILPISGTMSVHSIGWESHPRTQSLAIAAISLVTIMTVASGIFALLEAQRQNTDPPQQDSTETFNPTDLMDVLVASSIGSLANALSQPKDEEHRDKLTIELGVTTKGQSVLNACADDLESGATDSEV